MTRLCYRPAVRLSALLLFMLVLSAGFVTAADVPQRSSIDGKYKWRLADIYPTDADWQKAYDQLDAAYPHMAQYEGKLNQASDLLACLKLTDTLGLLADNLQTYAYLKLDQDNRESASQEMNERISSLVSRVSAAQSFVEPEILTLTADQIAAMLVADTGLKLYGHYLDNLNRTRAHVLSAVEENLMAQAQPLFGAPLRIFTAIDDADLTFGDVKDESGQVVALTKGRYEQMVESTNRDVRKAANHGLNNGYLKYINGMAATLNASVNKDWFLAKARKYPTCLDHSLFSSNIPTSVFHNLVNAVDANLAPLHKWAAMRKRILKLDTLYNYDLWANLLPGQTKKYTYEEAKQVILAGLKPMGPQYLKDFETGLNSGWVDVYETQGKGSGAYCASPWASHPYLLMNFNGTLDHVSTLAHEMGHAMHGYYTNKAEPFTYSGHPLFTAEVASTCNEAVLMKYMLANAKDPKERLNLLIKYIEQIVGTFYTQVMYSEFELAIHERVEKGDALSVDYFRKTYRDILQKFWGPDLTIDSINDVRGITVPHFQASEYYVYQYATCYAAAQAMSQRILEDKKFLPTYQKFLSTGNSEYAVDVLKDAGVDMTTPDPVNRTIKTFADLVDQVELLLNQNK